MSYKNIFYLLIITCCFAGSAEAGSQKFTPKKSEARSFQSKLDANANNYAACLLANVAYRKSENIGFTKRGIIKLCEPYKFQFYKSSFYSSFGGYGKREVLDRYRHNTAKKDVSIVEKSVFRRMKSVD